MSTLQFCVRRWKLLVYRFNDIQIVNALNGRKYLRMTIQRRTIYVDRMSSGGIISVKNIFFLHFYK